jgi:hypothetical protein
VRHARLSLAVFFPKGIGRDCENERLANLMALPPEPKDNQAF